MFISLLQCWKSNKSRVVLRLPELTFASQKDSCARRHIVRETNHQEE